MRTLVLKDNVTPIITKGIRFVVGAKYEVSDEVANYLIATFPDKFKELADVEVRPKASPKATAKAKEKE